jgi:hypothetical protein
MSLANFLQWLHDTQFSNTIRDSLWTEPIVETIHVLTLTLFLGFAVLLDMRLLGLAMRRRRMSVVLSQFNPWLFAGFTIMVVTGVILFCGDPVAFYSTTFFKVKMIMLVLAGVNVLIFNAIIGRRVAQWDTAASAPWPAKVAAIVSLVLWILIIAAGRGIAYAMPPP